MRQWREIGIAIPALAKMEKCRAKSLNLHLDHSNSGSTQCSESKLIMSRALHQQPPGGHSNETLPFGREKPHTPDLLHD
ncbi:hypothetical protein Ddc_09049 [Ditylenchus destructor]|nr:hypothetical protein Ddc_09049 [Ditylenchus destructor]